MNTPHDETVLEPSHHLPRWPWILLGCLLVAVGLAFYLLRSGDLERIGRDFLNRQLANTTNIRVSWRSLRGNPLRRVDLEGLRVEINVDGKWRSFLDADELTVDAGIPQLLRAGRLAVRAVRPVVWLNYDSTNALALPRTRSTGKGGKSSLELASLELVDGTVRQVRRGVMRDWILGIHGRGQIELRREPSIRIADLAALMPEKRLRVEHLEGLLQIGPEGWRWSDLRAFGPGFGVRTTGRFASARRFESTTQVDSMRSALISAWLPNPLPPGEFSGHVDAASRDGVIRFSESGRLESPRIGPARVNVRGEQRGRETRLAEYDIHTPHGDVRGSGVVSFDGHAHVTWTASNLDPHAAPFLPPGARLANTLLNGSGEVAVRWDRHGMSAADGRAHLAPSRLMGYAIQDADGVFNYAAGVLRLASLRAHGPAGELSGQMVVGPARALQGGGQLRVELAAAQAQIAKGARQRGQPQPPVQGTVSGAWTLGGTFDRPVAAGHFDLREMKWRTGGLDSGSADIHWSGPGLEGLSSNSTLRSLHVGSVRVPVAYLQTIGGRRMQVRLNAAVGDSSLRASGSVDWRGSTAYVDSGQLVLGKKRWRQRLPSSMSWGRETIAWKGVDWVSTDGDSIATTGRFMPRTETVDAQLVAARWDLGPLTAYFIHQNPPQGLLSGRVRVWGSLRDPQLDMDASVTRGVFSGRAVDSLALDGSLRAGHFDVSRVVLLRGSSRVTGHWSVDLPQLRSQGFRAFRGPSHELFASATMEGRLEFDPLDIGDLSEFNPNLNYTTGRARGAVIFRGTMASPVLDFHLTGDSVYYRDYNAGRVVLAAGYSGESLSLDTLLARNGAAVTSVTGQVPIHLSLDPFSFKPLDREMSLAADIHHGDLALISIFASNLVAYANGGFSLQAQVRGTPQHPRLHGEGSIENGTLRPAGRAEIFRETQAALAFDDQGIQLKSFQSRLGRKGVVRGSGTVAVGAQGIGAYHFDVQAQEATVTDQENYSATFSGNLTVERRNMRDLDALVRGRLHLTQGLILTEFGYLPPEFEPTHEKSTFRWYFDLDVEIPSNLWWRNSQAEIEVGNGEVRALNLNGINEGQGSVQIRRGTYDFADISFRIQDGSAAFNGPIQNPTLNLTAEATVSGLKIVLSVPGAKVLELNKPESIVLTTQPGGPQYSQSQIIEYLTVGRVFGADTTSNSANRNDNPSARLGGPAANYLFTRLKRGLLGQRGPFDVVEVGTDPTSSGLSVNQLGVGKYVTPDIFVRYAQGLGAAAQRDVAVEWRLNKILLLTGESKRQLITSGAPNNLENEYNVDMRARFEF